MVESGCVFVFCVIIIFGFKIAESGLNVFSLEDEDIDSLFITQESRNDRERNESECEMDGISHELLLSAAGAESEGKEGSKGGVVDAIYEDISDPEDDFVNPIYGQTSR